MDKTDILLWVKILTACNFAFLVLLQMSEKRYLLAFAYNVILSIAVWWVFNSL